MKLSQGHLNQEYLSKKWFFWSNPYKIKVLITFLIEMLKLQNLGHVTQSKIWFISRNKILLGTSWTEVMTSKPFIQNAFILRKPRVALFVDITAFVTTIFKNSKKLEELEILYWNSIYICIYWYSKTCWSLVKKCWCNQNSSGVSRYLYIF